MLALLVVTTAVLLGSSPADELPRLPPASLSLPAVYPPPPDPGPALEASHQALATALRSGSREGLGLQRASPLSRDYHSILFDDVEPSGSLSLGTIRSGSLRRPASLPIEGDHHQIIERHQSRNTNYGTQELVDAIESAARQVYQEHQGAPLRVGNLGFRRGGRIPWSSSHQAGRDADLAFYAVNGDGKSVPTPDLIGFDDLGRAEDHDDLYFDIPRNWALVRALLTDQTIKVQWLFVSLGLKNLLLLHALEIGEPLDLVRRASKVLHQPTDAPPHHDHLHLRIGCSQADRLQGCLDWGPQWEWHNWHRDALFAHTLAVSQAFDDPEPGVRREALRHLRAIQSPYAPEVAILRGVRDEDPDVRELAFQLLESQPISTASGLKGLNRALNDDLAPAARRLLYGALRRADHSSAADIALARLRDHALDDDERLRAIHALSLRTDPDLIPHLLEFLADEPSPSIRAAAAEILYRIAARHDGIDWSEPRQRAHDEALAAWEHWWNTTDPTRRAYLDAFAQELGASQWQDLALVDELIPRFRTAPDFEVYNLNRLLSQWTGRWAPRQWGDPRDAHRFWSTWWQRNRDRQLNSEPWPWEVAFDEAKTP